MGAPHKWILYAPVAGNRLRYIAETLFSSIEIVSDPLLFVKAEGNKINYSPEKFDGVFRVNPHGLLSGKEIKPLHIECFDADGLPVFFETEGDFCFDIFSASFYLLSRYEEYLPYEPDAYGRYPHTASLAYREGFLQKPLVHYWLGKLEKELNRFYRTGNNERLKVAGSGFQFIPTYDVDEAWSYLHKPLWKNVLGFYRDLLQGKMDAVVERGNVYSGRKKDPYDTFEWLDGLHEKYQLKPLYFLLTILKRGTYDKNCKAPQKPIRELYKRLSEKYDVGLHPSWQSGTDEWLLQKEKQEAEMITGKPITHSRNHYLRFTIPATYRRLLEAGFTDEYSMGYGAVNGFRASYAKPFYWYDLEKEEITSLLIHPFCFMEAVSFFSQGYSAEEAGRELQYYYDVVKEAGGEFITLFHNHFLTEQAQWIAWREMYETFLAKNFG